MNKTCIIRWIKGELVFLVPFTVIDTKIVYEPLVAIWERPGSAKSVV